MKWKRVGCAPSTWLLINLRTEETENTVWWPWQPFKCKDETLVFNYFLAKHSIRRFLPSKTLISISAQKSAVYLNLQPRRTCSYFTTYSASPYPCMSSAYKSVPPLENTEHTPINIYLCTQAKSFKRQNWLYPLYPKVTVIWRFLYNFILSRLWHIWHLFK